VRADPVITVRDLRVRYDGVDVVDGISFDVRPGEVLALLGPNGAGKTTTVEVLEGHRRRDGGSVQVLGFDPQRGAGRYRERIGIMLQEAGLDGELTVLETMRFYAALYPTPRRIDELISLVQLDEKRRARVQTLSGGQRRRLDLALALVGDPDIVFLDEPTTGFDPAARRQAWETLDDLRSLGKTVMLTSHYMEEVERLADRAVVLVSGHVVDEGPPATIGGRDHGIAAIRFRASPGWRVEQLPPGLFLSCEQHDGEVVLRTDQPVRALAALAHWALDRGEELDGLTVTRPTLEQVLLDLTEANR
jgi:ABC-2 type transport system ATP-binding protein